MSRLKITEGKSFIVRTSGFEDPRDNWYNIIVNRVNGFGKWVAESKSAILTGGTIEESEANAELIADAFNTANETQLLPSELKEQRDVLLAAVKINADIFNEYKKNKALTDNHRGELYSAELKLSELIDKIKDNE